MLKRRWQCPSIRCKIKDQYHHILYLKVEIFNTTWKQNIWVYTQMKWNSHIKYLNSKLSYYMINSLRGIMSQYILRNMYFAHFHVHLKYGLTLWGNDPERKRSFKLQKKIIRIISNVGRNASCMNLFRDLNILPLPCLYISEATCYTK